MYLVLSVDREIKTPLEETWMLLVLLRTRGSGALQPLVVINRISKTNTLPPSSHMKKKNNPPEKKKVSHMTKKVFLLEKKLYNSCFQKQKFSFTQAKVHFFFLICFHSVLHMKIFYLNIFFSLLTNKSSVSHNFLPLNYFFHFCSHMSTYFLSSGFVFLHLVSHIKKIISCEKKFKLPNFTQAKVLLLLFLVFLEKKKKCHQSKEKLEETCF